MQKSDQRTHERFQKISSMVILHERDRNWLIEIEITLNLAYTMLSKPIQNVVVSYHHHDLSRKSGMNGFGLVCGRWFWALVLSARQPSFTLPLFERKLMYSLGK